MRRIALGVIALVLFVSGVSGLLYVGGPDRDGSVAASIAIRAGLLLGAIWLAMPQLSRLLQRFPPWLLGSIGVGVLMLIVRPRLITYVLPLFGALLLIQLVAFVFRPGPRTAARTTRKRTASSENAERPN